MVAFYTPKILIAFLGEEGRCRTELPISAARNILFILFLDSGAQST